MMGSSAVSQSGGGGGKPPVLTNSIDALLAVVTDPQGVAARLQQLKEAQDAHDKFKADSLAEIAAAREEHKAFVTQSTAEAENVAFDAQKALEAAKAKETEIALATSEFETQKAALDAHTDALNRQCAALDALAAKLKDQQDALDDAHDAHAQIVADFEDRHAAAVKDILDLRANTTAELDRRTAELNQKEGSLAAREGAVATREDAIAKSEADYQARMAALAAIVGVTPIQVSGAVIQSQSGQESV